MTDQRLFPDSDQFGPLPDPNPCIWLWGHGPEGATCGQCSHLWKHGDWFKCGLRKFTHGPGTDHRKGWSACGKFEEAR